MNVKYEKAGNSGLRFGGRTCFRLLLALAASLSLVAGAFGAEQGAKPDQPAANKPAPSSSKENTMIAPPESPKQIWERLLKLLAEDNGYTPKDRVEAVLGIRFTEVEEESEHLILGAKYRYSLKSTSKEFGEFSAGLFDDPRQTGLSIRWGKKYAQSEHCLNLRTLADDLVAAGWMQLGIQSGGHGPGATSFGRPAEIQKIRELGRGIDPAKGDSIINLWSPFRPSDCVNGISTTVSRNPTR